MPTFDDARLSWRKSSRSGQVGDCVEVADAGAVIAVRDSKDPSGPRLGMTRQEWSRLVSQIRRGRHSL